MPSMTRGKLRSWLVLASSAGALVACGAPREATMQELHVPGLFTRNTAEMGVISTGGAHRVVTFRVNPETTNRKPAGAFCAEPPPDAVEAVASRLAAEFAARVPVGVGAQTVSNVEAQAAYERAFTTAVLAMTRRSQGLQYARDQTTAACQDYLNARTGRDVYVRWRERVMRDSQRLMREEMKHLPQMAGSIQARPLPERRGLPPLGGAAPSGGGGSAPQGTGSPPR